MGRASYVMLSLLCGSLACGCASADWEYTRWGMTPEQVAEASHGAVSVIPLAKRQKTEELKLESGAEGSFSDGPLKFHVGFNFSSEGQGLVMVVYSLEDRAQNGQLKDWLIKKYGPPQRTGGMPEVGLETLDWKGAGKDDIELDIPKDQPAVVMHSPPEKN